MAVFGPSEWEFRGLKVSETVDRRLAEIAAMQGGHVARRQLLAMEVNRGGIEARLERGALIAVYHGVYAVGHVPTNPRDRAHGALLAAGSRSALANWSALAFWLNETKQAWPEPVELVSPLDRRPKGVIVHRDSALLRRDIRTVDGLRVTSPARTALDIAPLTTGRRLTRIVNDLRHERRLTVAQLHDVIDRSPRHPGTQAIRKLLGTSQKEHTRSELEEAFMRLVQRHGLPIPLVNVHVGGHRVDAYFPDHGLVVELDGQLTHATDWKPAFEHDRARAVDVMVATGLPTIRFTWDQVTRHQKRTAAKLEQILEARVPERQISTSN